MHIKSLSQRRPYFICEIWSMEYVVKSSFHHYFQPGSSEVVVNYDLQPVILVKLCSADASLTTPFASAKHQTREKGLFHCSLFPLGFPIFQHMRIFTLKTPSWSHMIFIFLFSLVLSLCTFDFLFVLFQPKSPSYNYWVKLCSYLGV